MKRASYNERDYSFGQAMLTLRNAIGLTQMGLADLLGISRRAVSEWEAGSSYPKAEHLKRLIELGVRQYAFPAGREVEEIGKLWKAAHQKVFLDEQWLSALFGQQRVPSPRAKPQLVEESYLHEPAGAQSVPGPRIDWEDALAVPIFYGREQEAALLAQWVLQDRCHLVGLLGMGGIGKSALAVNVMHRLAEHFEVIIFRSLRDAPSCEELLDDCLQVLSPQPTGGTPTSLERRISLLLERLHAERVLLVLDNLESLLEKGDIRGHLRPGYEGYGRLLRQVAEMAHQSCLLLTSREKPAELRLLEGKYAPARSLRLSGLDTAAGKQLLTEKEVVGTPQEQARLVEVYTGNPLALKIVAETISELFDGEIGQFLSDSSVIFGGITDLLSEQFARLSAQERTVLCWLAIMREPVTIDELLAILITPLPRVQVLEAVDNLRQRCLIERGKRPGSFTLQSVVLEYVTSVLIEEMTREIRLHRLDHLIQYGLEQAYAREYVRQTQERLLIDPIIADLRREYRLRTEVEEQLLSLLDLLRERASYAQGYGPANLIALLCMQRGHLRGVDLSQLVIRGAYLQGIEMQDASLAGATIRDTVFTETLNAPWSVAISSSGEYWAAGSKQGKVHVWRKGVQTLHLVWQAHTDTIIALSFSPDGYTLVTGSWDGSIKLWDVANGALLWSGWHMGSVNSVAFAPDGSILASSANDVGVRLWNPQSGIMLQTLPHPCPVYAIVWSPDGHLLVSGDFEGQIRLWEIRKTQPATCVQTLTGHGNWVAGLAIAPDGSILASASWDHTVKLWEMASGRLLQTLTGHADQVNRVTWSRDGRILASCGYDKTIRLWDVEHRSYRPALYGHDAAVYSIAMTSDSSSLLSGSEDGTLHLWDLANGQCMRVMKGYAVAFYDIDWSPDGTQLASAGTDGLVTIWDLTGEMEPRVLYGHSWIVFGVGWRPDGRLLASSSWDKVIRLWDPTTGVCRQILRDPDDPDTLFYGVRWSPDGRQLACGTYKHGVYVWDMNRHSHRWVGRTHPMWIDDIAWSPDGTKLASTSHDGSVYLWDAADGTLWHRLWGPCGKVNGVEWSHDGSRLASCGGGEGRGELYVWDVQSGERLQDLAGFAGMVYAVAWGVNDDLLISGGSDGGLRWWDIASGACIRIREAHRGTIQSLRRSPDGHLLASCGDDGAIRIWDLQSAELLRTLRSDRPYERLNITGIKGLTEAQKDTLRVLGAI